MVETILRDYQQAHDLRSVSLRYFNAAGADPCGGLAERHEPETHLIPIVLEAAVGKRPHVVVYGGDYSKADGTCVCDYVHVTGLCHAHLLALSYLEESGSSAAFSLGNGGGFSAREVIEAARTVTGRRCHCGSRRLGGQSEYTSLEPVVEHAWRALHEYL